MLILTFLKKRSTVKHLEKLQSFSRMSISRSVWDIRSMRTLYRSRSEMFTEDKLVAKEPIAQFHSWFEEVSESSQVLEPNAMCLATCTKNGYPSARYVLMKEYGEDGFKFFTNYTSRKGKELSENPQAAAVFYWAAFHRSVRIEGKVEKLSEAEADEYFHSRDKASQIGAAISQQSEPISNRDVLVERETYFLDEYGDNDEIPRPKDWGGYIIKPNAVEFWQGQSDRIHDRIRFRLREDNDVVDEILLHEGVNGWVYERLQP